MNNLDRQYIELLQDILENGTKRQDRTGTGTISVFGRQIRHKMSDGFPLVTTKKMAFKTMVTELIWFLRGDTNIKYLVDNGCHIWDGDCYANYLKKRTTANKDNVRVPHTLQNGMTGQISRPFTQEEFIKRIKTDNEFAKRWGELGPVYGAQWRSWKKNDSFIVEDDVWKNNEGWCSLKDFNKDELYIDQIANLINDLKTNPDSRRLLVSAWNPSDLPQQILPPCHYSFQVYTRELTASERITYKNTKQINLLDSNELYDFIKSNVTMDLDNQVHKECDESNIPTRAISIMWNQRSVDTFLGLPFNIASYGLLLMMIADEVNMVPDELIGNLGDTHLYLNHIEQAKEQIGRDLTYEERYDIWFNNNYETGMERNFDPNNLPNFDDDYYVPTPKRTREPFKLPTVHVRDGIYSFMPDDIILENYQSHPTIKAPLSN
jgi:thymidylate synthase